MIGHQIRDLPLVEAHFNLIKDFKRAFINNSRVLKYEAYKIWSSWIITHLSLDDQIDTFIPTENIETDQQILQHLSEKGCPAPKEFYDDIIDQCKRLIQKFHELRTHSLEPSVCSAFCALSVHSVHSVHSIFSEPHLNN